MGFTLTFDPRAYTFVSAAPGQLNPGWLLADAAQSQPGTVTAGAMGLKELPAGVSGCLFQFVFTAVDGLVPDSGEGFALGALTDDLAGWRLPLTRNN